MKTPQRKRRLDLGPHASAALPVVWKELARKNWSHAQLARALGISTAAVTGLLYGDHGPGRRVSALLDQVLATKLGDRWDKPCPPSWKPNAYEQLRPGAKTRVVGRQRRLRSSPLPAPASKSTGTDD